MTGSTLSGFQLVCDVLLIGKIGFYLFPVCVVVGQCSKNLGQRNVAYLVGNFLRAQSQLIPLDDPPNSDPRTGNPRPAPPYVSVCPG